MPNDDKAVIEIRRIRWLGPFPYPLLRIVRRFCMDQMQFLAANIDIQMVGQLC